jgi:glutaconate CoA-transferase, subunit A
MPLAEAVAQHVRDGQSLALEGFTHLIPFAAGHEIIRQGRRGLHLIRMTPDLIYDQMIGMGCAQRLTFSWGGNPGVGSLHRLRDAVERGWPRPLAITERTHAEMAVAYQAGASGLPCGLMRHFDDTDLDRAHESAGNDSHDDKRDREAAPLTCPFSGERLLAVPALNPDVTILHAQQVDRAGNVLIRGILGAAREAALAARCVLVTVEEQVERLDAPPNAAVLPHALLAAVSIVPGGAHPSYAAGCYERDNRFYLEWDEISRERGAFEGWMREHVLTAKDHGELLRRLGVAA